MWKALRKFKEEGGGKVDENGNGILTSGKKASGLFSSSQEQSKYGSWRFVAEKLYLDIVSGRYTEVGRLPSAKELQRTLDVSFATLKKALSVLIEEKIIEPHTNGYIIPTLCPSIGHSRIAAIACGWEDGKIWIDHQDKSYFRALESECIKMNIQLDVIVYFRTQERLRFIHSATKKDFDLNERSILGYIFIVANLESAPEEVLERLAGLRRNVAVLDVVGGWNIPRSVISNRFVRFFTTTTSAVPAKRVAQYLLNKGHKKAAFFSPFHRALWSKLRLNTITDMYKRAGLPDGVVAFVRENYAYQWDYLKNQAHKEDIRSIIHQYEEWKKEAHSGFFRRFGNLGYSIVKYVTEWNCASGEIYEEMRPLFESALSDPRITAWIAANDFAATIAMDFLKERNVRIPEEISVISFDNTIDAMEYQLTSYDFNNNGIVNMMVRFLLAPQTIKPPRSGIYLETEGNLIVRRSTGNAALRSMK